MCGTLKNSESENNRKNKTLKFNPSQAGYDYVLNPSIVQAIKLTIIR